MKVNKQWFLLFLFFLFFNQGFVLMQEKHKKYRTFSEYNLHGEYPMDKDGEPHVIVDSLSDTIKVKLSFEDDFILYLNRVKYWYSYSERYISLTDKVGLLNVKEKFIYNDTILIHSYNIHNYGDTVGIGEDRIILETPLSALYLFYDEETLRKIHEKDKEVSRFYLLKSIVSNYEEDFVCNYLSDSTFSEKSYTFLNKIFKEDTLFLYNNCKESQDYSLFEVRLLNSLGEFDPDKGVNITNKYKKMKNPCFQQ